MKKIYIHIGVHKTGTTSIQHFLYHNRTILEKCGYAYPDIDISEAAHHNLGNELIKDAGLSIFSKDKALISRSGNSFPCWQRLRNFIKKTPCVNIVISSEQFEWLTTPSIIREILGQYDYEIIVYLRRPDRYLESLYQSFVKNPYIRATKVIVEWLKGTPECLKYHDFLHLLDRWADVFGEENISAFIFEKEAVKGLELGFLKALQIDSNEYINFSIPPNSLIQRKRESLDARCIEFIRLCNMKNFTVEQRSKLLSIIIGISDLLKTNGDFQKYLMPMQNRMEIMSSVEESNTLILKKYFRGETELFPAIDEPDADSHIIVKKIIPLFVEFVFSNNEYKIVQHPVSGEAYELDES